MPARDGTGPMGQGPMTGRGAGYCMENASPGLAPAQGQGRGWGGGGRGRGLGACGFRGQGRGRGGGYGFGGPGRYAAPWAGAAQQEELGLLKGQAEYFEDALDGIKKRIGELEAKQED